METFPIRMDEERTLEELLAFLKIVRSAAEGDGHYKIVSITKEVHSYLDPLAVLGSIYQAEDLHCYMERWDEDSALAAAESVVSAEFSGASRFADAQAWAEDVLEHTIAAGDIELEEAGPRFFSAFSFADEVEPGAVFAPATLFIPHWLIVRKQGRTYAIAHTRVDADSEVEHKAQRLWDAHARFSELTSNASGESQQAAAQPTQTPVEVGDVGDFECSVSTALGAIEAGEYEKIVLSRAVDITLDRPLEATEALHRLRERFPSCTAFSFSNSSNQSFIGATPERLMQLANGELSTEAIAGSIARGKTAQEDAEYAGKLMNSEKDLREHQAVIASITNRLADIGIKEPRTAARPRLLQLANVQHLYTPIIADAGTQCHPLQIVATLHPTPAVGGKPREKAVPAIRNLENFDRGLYAGVLGWFDHWGRAEFVVCIRCALLEDNRARLYAGAGIVAGSQPKREREETDWKLQAMLQTVC